ncbi:hypothetical protein NDU88_000708 [Pleurodeles waltl]|uniref:Uncharacterized protein n=1 Tax=Pleurodeles waltl TaxID=8319 RepID=A0AAV7U552_PLEWA|nr:hypothetical protein NDU88_000708 [Pleurodeles waltl]
MRRETPDTWGGTHGPRLWNGSHFPGTRVTLQTPGAAPTKDLGRGSEEVTGRGECHGKNRGCEGTGLGQQGGLSPPLEGTKRSAGGHFGWLSELEPGTSVCPIIRRDVFMPRVCAL